MYEVFSLEKLFNEWKLSEISDKNSLQNSITTTTTRTVNNTRQHTTSTHTHNYRRWTSKGLMTQVATTTPIMDSIDMSLLLGSHTEEALMMMSYR